MERINESLEGLTQKTDGSAEPVIVQLHTMEEVEEAFKSVREEAEGRASVCDFIKNKYLVTRRAFERLNAAAGNCLTIREVSFDRFDPSYGKNEPFIAAKIFICLSHDVEVMMKTADLNAFRMASLDLVREKQRFIDAYCEATTDLEKKRGFLVNKVKAKRQGYYNDIEEIHLKIKELDAALDEPSRESLGYAWSITKRQRDGDS
jgi:cell fate (sporulation/competence/biofilm development) regulator YlbF (YheA/YmcA/DUF963 family)